MAECEVERCGQQRVYPKEGLCQSRYGYRYKGGLAGVTADEVDRRREQYAQRLAGCPLEQWLARRRPVIGARDGVGCFQKSGNSKRYTSCECGCHRKAA